MCSICHNEIEPARKELGMKICFSCASKTVKKVRGDMNYQHKTAPVLMIMSPETFSDYRRYVPYSRHSGRGSGVHKMSKPTVSLK